MFHVIYIPSHSAFFLPRRFSFFDVNWKHLVEENNSYVPLNRHSPVFKDRDMYTFSWALAFLDDLCIKIMQNKRCENVCSRSYGIEIENTQWKMEAKILWILIMDFDFKWWWGKNEEDRKVLQKATRCKKERNCIRKKVTNSASYVWRFGMRD